MRRLFRQFSFPGGVPSHVAPETPGSIHEGGELGYALAHAYGAAFDNPDLLVCCVVGDGEAETGPLAASWHCEQVPRPRRTTAPCCRSCTSTATRSPTRRCSRGSRDDELRALLEGYGHHRRLRRGRRPRRRCIGRWPPRSTRSLDDDRRDPATARTGGVTERPRWPMIVLRTPKGWTGPQEVDGRRSRALALAPGAARRRCATTRSTSPSSRRGCARTGPRSCSTSAACRVPSVARTGPGGRPADGREPARQRRPAAARPAAAGLPRIRGRRRRAGDDLERGDPRARRLPARRDPAQPEHASGCSARTRRPRTGSAPCSRRPTARGTAELRAGRRPPRPRRPRDGGAQRAPVPGLAGGVPADRPPRAVQLLRGVHPHRRLDVQPAREVAEGDARRSRGGGRSRR